MTSVISGRERMIQIEESFGSRGMVSVSLIQPTCHVNECELKLTVTSSLETVHPRSISRM